jgi:hypothetical protein
VDAVWGARLARGMAEVAASCRMRRESGSCTPSMSATIWLHASSAAIAPASGKTSALSR